MGRPTANRLHGQPKVRTRVNREERPCPAGGAGRGALRASHYLQNHQPIRNTQEKRSRVEHAEDGSSAPIAHEMPNKVNLESRKGEVCVVKWSSKLHTPKTPQQPTLNRCWHAVRFWRGAFFGS